MRPMSACDDGSELERSLEGNGIGSDPMRMIMIHDWIIGVTLSILAWAVHSSDTWYVVDYAINPEIFMSHKILGGRCVDIKNIA